MDTNRFRYCGEYYDIESGTIYLRARYYDASTGRFTSEDPIKDGTNWYSYCAGNSVNRWDPSGMKRIDKHIALESGNPVKVIKPQKADTHIALEDDGSGDGSTSDDEKNGSKTAKEIDIGIVQSATHDLNRRPNSGEPGSTWTGPNGDSRTYGSDGKPQHDYDHDDHDAPDKHPHDNKGGHNHDWKDGKRGPAYSVTWKTILGIGIIVFCVIGIILVAADDVTVVGIANDFLLGPLGMALTKGLTLIYG